MDVRDTDDYLHTRELRERLYAGAVAADGGCLLADPLLRRHITVTLKGFRGSARASIVRVAWAFAHPESHLAKTDRALHSCANSGPNTCCIAPAHLLKCLASDLRTQTLLLAEERTRGAGVQRLNTQPSETR